jgi:hypothetical protein
MDDFNRMGWELLLFTGVCVITWLFYAFVGWEHALIFILIMIYGNTQRHEK